MELPNGVFITMMPRAVAAGMSTLSTPMPARPMTFRFFAFSRILADQRGELLFILAERGLEIDFDAAVLEDLHGGGRQSVGDKYTGCHDFQSC
jgi:hypothetical protein